MSQANSETGEEATPATLDQEEPESVSLNRLLIAGGIVGVGLIVILLVVFTGGSGGSGSEGQSQQAGAASSPADPQGETFMDRPKPETTDPPGRYRPTSEFAGSTPAGGSPAAAPPTGQNYPQNLQPRRAPRRRPAAGGASGPSPEEQRFQEALGSKLLVLSSSRGGGSSGPRAGAEANQGPAGGALASGEELPMGEQVQRRMRQLRQRYGPPGQRSAAAAPPQTRGQQGGARRQDPSGPSNTFQRRVAAQSSGSAYYEAQLRRPRSPYELDAGTVVPAVLMTAINSELPGSVVAQVSRDVYDSASQQHVLIPKGSKLIGTYDDQVALGQSRALVSWTRIQFPGGRSMQLPGLDSKDLSGASGVEDEVNRHYARIFGSAVALSAVGAGFQLSQPDGNRGFGRSRDPQQVLAAELGRELSRVATEMIRRNMDIQPTIKIRKGYRFYVFFRKDLAFAAPYRPAASGVRFSRFSPPVRRQVRGRVGRFPPQDTARAGAATTTARNSREE